MFGSLILLSWSIYITRAGGHGLVEEGLAPGRRAPGEGRTRAGGHGLVEEGLAPGRRAPGEGKTRAGGHGFGEEGLRREEGGIADISR